MKNIIVFILFFYGFSVGYNQELECEVTMNIEQLTAEARENIINFDRKIEEYINNYRWTKDNFGDEKIKLSIDIFFKGSPSADRYIAQLFIGSQRPIYKSNKNTGLIRILDEKWEFTYNRNQPMYHNNFQFDPVTSLIDFYVYVILGFDYDSYKSLDGAEYFQKALDITSKAQGASSSIGGWEQKLSGAYSRSKFIEEITNPKFSVVRDAIYQYHYKGLDLFYKNKTKGQQNILKALESINKFLKKIGERSVLVKVFFDTKYLEFCEIFLDYDDPLIYKKLIAIDPSHQKFYEEYELKRQKY